eukprot:GEMP01045480.1.p1 GENE.GEMP01045480.1~~GEMP01045480.1.p1  ORF type:complete len:444 (+),score=98.42 GEMP01045480.1:129-1460(+)
MAFWLCLVTAGLVSGATVGTWSVTCDPVVCSSTDAAVCAQEQAQFQANCDQKIAAAKGKAEADTAAANLAAQITAADAAAIAAGSPAVVCGGHLASVCEKCGNTAGSCNGDCVWKGTICRRGAIKATTTTTRAPGGTLTQPTSTGNATPTTSGGANTGSGNTGGGSTGDGANTGSDKKTGSDTNAGSGSNEGSSTGGDNGSAASARSCAGHKASTLEMESHPTLCMQRAGQAQTSPMIHFGYDATKGLINACIVGAGASKWVGLGAPHNATKQGAALMEGSTAAIFAGDAASSVYALDNGNVGKRGIQNSGITDLQTTTDGGRTLCFKLEKSKVTKAGGLQKALFIWAAGKSDDVRYHAQARGLVQLNVESSTLPSSSNETDDDEDDGSMLPFVVAFMSIVLISVICLGLLIARKKTLAKKPASKPKSFKSGKPSIKSKYANE